MDKTKKEDLEDRKKQASAELKKIEAKERLEVQKVRLEKILAKQRNEMKKTEEEMEKLVNPPPVPVFTRPKRTSWWKRVWNRLRGYSNA